MSKEKKMEEKKTKELEQRVEELTAGWQRTQADFLNYKKQSEIERQRLIKMASVDLLGEILPVLDNFQLAAKHTPEELKNNNWVTGIKQIECQLEEILANEGLKKINTLGEEFNPEFHEAVDQVESERPEGEIVEEIQAGYTFDNIVLRPAKVKISKGLKSSSDNRFDLKNS